VVKLAPSLRPSRLLFVRARERPASNVKLIFTGRFRVYIEGAKIVLVKYSKPKLKDALSLKTHSHRAELPFLSEMLNMAPEQLCAGLFMLADERFWHPDIDFSAN
jgi:hypothetical protein